MTISPEALNYYCRTCDGMRIHVLSTVAPRYHCGVCDRSVTAVEVAANYSTLDVGDPEILIIVDPYASRVLTKTEQESIIVNEEEVV